MACELRHCLQCAMRLRHILLILLLAGLALGWQAETRAALEQRGLLRSLAVQLEPFGSLSYAQGSAHFWGSGKIRALRFAPHPDWLARQGLPANFAVAIPELRYSHWEQGNRWPNRIRLSFETAQAPLPAPWPITYTGTLDWQYQEDSGQLTVAFALQAPEALAVEGTTALQLATPATWVGAVLQKSELSYRDLGWALNAHNGLAPSLGAARELAQNIQQFVALKGLPLPTAAQTTLLAFTSQPDRIHLTLDPPGSLRLDMLDLFAPADRAAALGLSLETP